MSCDCRGYPHAHEVYNGPDPPPFCRAGRVVTSVTPVSNRKSAPSTTHGKESLFCGDGGDKPHDNRSSRNSSTSVASSSMFSSPPKRDIDSMSHLHTLQDLHLEGAAHGTDEHEWGFQLAHPQRIEEVDENESMSSSSRLESLTSSPSPTKFAERGLHGKLDELMLNVEWAPLAQGNEQPISVQIGCKCHGLHVHRKELDEEQPEWKLRPVEIARDLVASFVELIQHSASTLDWSKAYLLHDIEWANGFCWGGDASYDVHRDGPIVLTADTSTTCPRMTHEARQPSFDAMIRKMVKVIERRDAAAIVTVGETDLHPDGSLHAVLHVNHFCTK